jgi:hypothetical protein
MFHPALAPSQDEIESLVGRASKRILRFLQRRKVITLVTAPGDGEVRVVRDETMGEKDPLLAKLLAAATAGAAPAGRANQRQPLRIVLDPDDRPVGKGTLCAQTQGFNLGFAPGGAILVEKSSRTCRIRLKTRPGAGIRVSCDGNASTHARHQEGASRFARRQARRWGPPFLPHSPS